LGDDQLVSFALIVCFMGHYYRDFADLITQG